MAPGLTKQDTQRDAELREATKDWPICPPNELVTSPGGDQLFYPDATLIKKGYQPCDFLLVRIGPGLYELQGHVGRETKDGGFWWVNEVHG